MKLLYCKRRTKTKNENEERKRSVKSFVPFLGKLYLPGEKKNMKTTLVRLYFQAMTLGKAKLYYVVDETGRTAHVSYVVPKCFKFSFLDKRDYEIGPCFTAPEFRGQGIYPTVLNYVTENVGANDAVFYMVVDDKNVASIRGIEKARFERCGTIRKVGLFKRYIREE